MAEVFYARHDWQPPAPPDFDKCGVGQGPLCCKFAVMGPELECARYSALHATLIERPMSAAFIPEDDDCQAERLEASKR